MRRGMKLDDVDIKEYIISIYKLYGKARQGPSVYNLYLLFDRMVNKADPTLIAQAIIDGFNPDDRTKEFLLEGFPAQYKFIVRQAIADDISRASGELQSEIDEIIRRFEASHWTAIVAHPVHSLCLKYIEKSEQIIQTFRNPMKFMMASIDDFLEFASQYPVVTTKIVSTRNSKVRLQKMSSLCKKVLPKALQEYVGEG